MAKETIVERHFAGVKRLWALKNAIKNVKRQRTERQIYLQMMGRIRVRLPGSTSNSYDSTTERQTAQLRTGEALKQVFLRRRNTNGQRRRKRRSTSLATREMQKNTTRCHRPRYDEQTKRAAGELRGAGRTGSSSARSARSRHVNEQRHTWARHRHDGKRVFAQKRVHGCSRRHCPHRPHVQRQASRAQHTLPRADGPTHAAATWRSPERVAPRGGSRSRGPAPAGPGLRNVDGGFFRLTKQAGGPRGRGSRG